MRSRAPERGRRRASGCRVRAGSLTASGLVVSRDSQLVLDVEEDALLAVEEALADVRPPAEVGDGEEAGRAGRVEVGLDALDDRAVALGREDLLRLGRVEVVEERLGPSGLFVVLTIAAGFSIRIVSSGTTYSIGWPACWAKIASFS